MKKFFALTLALLMLVGIVTGCGSTNTPKATDASGVVNGEAPKANVSTGDVTLTMWTFLDITNASNGRAQVLAKLIENFEAINPGVKIKVETQDWTTLASKTFAAAESGECPDIFMVNTANLGEAINRGICEPLENLFYNDWTDEMKDDIDSAIFEQSYDGTYHYEIPLFYGVFGVMYRKDLFKEKNIDPESIKSWEDLAKAAQLLTYENANGQKIWGYGIGYSLDVLDPHGALPAILCGQDGGMFNDAGMPNNWTGDAAQQALQMELDLVNKYGVTPQSAASITSEDVYTDFSAGNYAMIAAGSIRMPTVQGNSSFNPEDIGFLAVPGLNEENVGKSFAAGWNCAVWSGSENKAIAGKFLESMCSVEADELWVTEAQQIPLLKSTLKNCSEFLSQPKNQYVTQAKDILQNAYVQSINYNISGFNEDLQNAFQMTYVEGYDIKEALAEAEQNFIDRNTGR